MMLCSGKSLPETPNMQQKIMEVLTLAHCSHEFSWPRRAEDGEFYQVCMLCAGEYKYDWKTMRRTERLGRSTPETPSLSHQRSHARKQTWLPRARRLKLSIAMRFRVKALAAWYPATVVNISQSGVLFRAQQGLPENTIVEMRFEMPEEISGQRDAMVFCQGRVTRGKQSSEDGKEVVMAASILDYQFDHEK
jgi:hypothetical protein